MKINALDLDKLNSKDPKVKYGFAKELLKIGADTPELLYDYFDYWTNMMTSDKNILKWTAIDILGYLSVIDKDNKTDKVINNLIDILHCGNLITCNHAVFSLGLIAKNKPNHRIRIITELIAISNDTFYTDECKNIATGKVIETIKDFLDNISNDKKVLDFIKQAQHYQRNATKKKADSLMTKIKNYPQHGWYG
jgi:uncharacterized protein YdbL (DUF1318 family)